MFLRQWREENAKSAEDASDSEEGIHSISRQLSEASFYATEDEEEARIQSGPKMSIKQHLEKDKDDESLWRWKEQLLGSVDASAVEGFISIDCGISGNSNYTDEMTGRNYVSDSGFTDSGESRTILPIHITASPEKQLLIVRSFPQGTRNCYTLKPTQGKGNRYLIKAWFMYGNFDSKSQLPQFDLRLGADKWDTISFNKTTSKVSSEIVHVPMSDYIHVCLINTGQGTPFISALELRFFNNSM